MRYQFLAITAFLGLFLGGCAADTRPKYIAPTLPAAEIVTLKGVGGFHIDSVDGGRLDGPGIVVFGGLFQGNTVQVSPGEHSIELSYNTGTVSGTKTFNYRFQAGHTYSIAPESVLSLRIKVTDETANSSTIVQ